MMKRAVLFCLALGALPPAYSQEDPPGLSAASANYHRYRLADTWPLYELNKVQNLINHAKDRPNEGGDSGTLAISDKGWRSLRPAAKFTYCMIHGELYSQNCDGMPAFVGEETKIFAQPAAAFNNEQDWSDRQITFLQSRHSSVVEWIRKAIRTQNRVGVNLKKAILEIDANELVPDLVAQYWRSSRDKDVLSVLCLLMKHRRFAPFVKSPLFKALYSGDASYQTFVPCSRDTEKFIIDCALRFSKQENR